MAKGHSDIFQTAVRFVHAIFSAVYIHVVCKCVYRYECLSECVCVRTQICTGVFPVYNIVFM